LTEFEWVDDLILKRKTTVAQFVMY